jgi:hypothetical protein
MTLQYVSLICDLFDGGGNVVSQDTASFVPTVVVTDSTDHEIVTLVPITAAFKVTGPPSVSLLATDGANLRPPGCGWTCTPPAATGITPFTFFLPYSGGATQYLSALAPTSSSATMAAYLPLAGGDMTGSLAPAVATLTGASTITVNATSANIFDLAMTSSAWTMGNPSGLADGQSLQFRIQQPASGGPFTLAWGTAYDFGAAGAPVLSTAASKVDLVGFQYCALNSKLLYLGSGLGF